MTKKSYLGLFIVLTLPLILLFQNFTPAQIASAQNARTYIISHRGHLDALPIQNFPYIEDKMGIFELPASANLKPGSYLKNPHRYNACKDLYTPAAAIRMKTQFFNVQSFGAVGTGVSAPFQKYQTLRTPYQITGHQNLVKKMFKSPRLEASDEMDWIGIQSAMVAAHLAGGGTVLIPDTGKNYLLNRPVWLYSNVRIVWLTNPKLTTHSYVQLTKNSGSIGTVFGSYNPYVNDLAIEKLTLANSGSQFTTPPTPAQLAVENLHRKTAVGFVCKSYFYEPRVIALTGENAISFAKGTYDVQIYGGTVKGARFGTEADVAKGFSPQGGKGIQMESGVQQAVVDGLSISDSTIGLSASAGLYLTVRDNPVRYANAAHRITFRNISMRNVDLPFLLSNLAFAIDSAETRSLAPQSVLIENFDLKESGRLSFKHPNAYKSQSYYMQSGIFGLLGGSNITIRHSKGQKNQIENSNIIGSLVKGFGRNIVIKDIAYKGTLSSIIDVHTPIQNAASGQRMENLQLSNLDQDGRFGFMIRLPSPLVSRNLNGKVVEYYVRRLVNIKLTDIFSSGNPANAYYSPESKDLRPAEISRPNVIYQINGRVNHAL